MDAQPHNVSWALAIEALAYSHEVDVNTLIHTFNSCPKFTNDVGSNAREMVSFRILERLFDPDTRRSKSVGRISGFSFDFSKRCEDVLEHILRETPEQNTWNESEMSKWHMASPSLHIKDLACPNLLYNGLRMHSWKEPQHS